MKIRLILLFLTLMVAGTAAAQNMTLSARVQDVTTAEPLPFASVGIKGKSIGTITNLQGEFDFHFSAEYRNEILVISMLGYKNFEAPVWSLINAQEKIIRMVKSSTVLNEVVVSDSLTGGEIFRIAVSRIDQNYPMKPFMLDGFYRDVKKVGGTYIALLEAAVKVYDENYAEPRNKSKLRERVKLIEVRKSLGYENRFTTFFGQANLLEDLLLHNNVRYRQIDTTDDLLAEFKREGDSHYNNQEVYVVSYNDDFKLTCYIDKADYAIVHIDFETNLMGDRLARKKKMVSKHMSFTQALDFKRYNGKMFLNYITVTTKENWYHEDQDSLQFQTELIQSFLVNAVYPDTRERIGSTEKMRNYGLQYQDYPYNKEFWDSYNVIKETPLDRQILEDLEKLAPLDKQFQEQ